MSCLNTSRMGMKGFNSVPYYVNSVNMMIRETSLRHTMKECIWRPLMKFTRKLSRSILLSVHHSFSLDLKLLPNSKISTCLIKHAHISGQEWWELTSCSKKIHMDQWSHTFVLEIALSRNGHIFSLKKFIMLAKPRIILIITLSYLFVQAVCA